ncbi:MAG: MFS transporter [Holosporaceae bacterium]|jgi:DHA1 family bicyclomycin/chloramphenicol resistance-like MFS transporter|nr:MFS transporter [Holosporaceae bacterium]
MKRLKGVIKRLILKTDGTISNKRVAFFLLFLNVVTSAAVSIYLPCLKQIAVDLETTNAVAQMTLVTYLIGEFVGRAACGPFIEAYGIRAVILPSLAISIGGHWGCMLSSSSMTFMIMRFMQAIGSSVVYVVSQSVINERFNEREKSGVLGILELYQPIAWILSPFVGSILAEISDWRAAFLALSLAQLVGLAFFWVYPAKASEKSRKVFFSAKFFRGYKHVLNNYSFVIHALIPGLFAGGYMIFATSAPFICSKFGLNNSANIAIFSAIPLFFYVLATFAYRAIVKRYRLRIARRVGACVYGVFGVYIVYLTLHHSPWTPIALLTLMCLQCAGSAFLVPTSILKALHAANESTCVGASTVVMFRNLVMSVCISMGAKFSGSITTVMSCVFLTVATVLVLIMTRKIIKNRGKRRRACGINLRAR